MTSSTRVGASPFTVISISPPSSECNDLAIIFPSRKQSSADSLKNILERKMPMFRDRIFSSGVLQRGGRKAHTLFFPTLDTSGETLDTSLHAQQTHYPLP